MGHVKYALEASSDGEDSSAGRRVGAFTHVFRYQEQLLNQSHKEVVEFEYCGLKSTRLESYVSQHGC